MPGTNVLYFYKYKIASVDIIFPNESTPTKVDPKQVTGLVIERDYDNDYFPVMRIGLSLDTKTYVKVTAYKLDVKIRIRMQKYVYDADKKFKFKYDVFNDLFAVFIDDNTPFMAEKSYNKEKDIEKTEKSPRDLGSEYSFYLFKENDLSASKRILNAIISGATMTNAVTYCLATSGINKVLMSPIENKGSYDEILLPPLTVLGNLLYLEQQYGFYNNGALIFFDIDCMYILDNSPACTAWRNQEYKQTVLFSKESTNSQIFAPGSYINETEKRFYMNVNPNNINVTSDSVVADQVDGNHMIIITPSAGSVDGRKTEGTMQRGDGSYKMMVNKYGNQFGNNVAKVRKAEESNKISVNMGDYDIDALSPNKEFIFIFENSKINNALSGSYRITKNMTYFVKQGEEFAISCDCEFKKKGK